MTAITAPPTVSPLPPAPLVTDAVDDFKAKSFDFVAAQSTQVTQMNALATNVFNNATAAQERADAAQVSAGTAAAQIGLAAAQVTLAEQARAGAQAFAQTAVNAPGTSGTSTTSLAISPGVKSLVTQSGKAWTPGQPVAISRTSDAVASQMYGVISSYNASTGALNVSVPADGVVGSGTFSDWTIALAGRTGPASMVWTPVTTTSHAAQDRQELALRNAAATTVTLPASPADGARVTMLIENGRRDNVFNGNGKPIMGYLDNLQCDDPDVPWPLVFSSFLNSWRIA